MYEKIYIRSVKDTIGEAEKSERTSNTETLSLRQVFQDKR